MKISWYRFLDWAGSKWRRYKKIRRLKKRWPGSNPIDMERTGRQYSRVQVVSPGMLDDNSPLHLAGRAAHLEESARASFSHFERYVIRPEPGWEWTCQQCHTYSLIRESDMPAIRAEFAAYLEKARRTGYRPAHGEPTAATAGCPECKFRPGAPE